MGGCATTEKEEKPMDFPARQEDFGWETEAVEPGRYAVVYYVSPSGSDETGDGSREHPFASPWMAIERFPGTSEPVPGAVLVAGGAYGGKVIHMQEYLDLFGGFDPASWERDIQSNKTVLSGGEKTRVLTGADHSRLDGFFIMGGRHRGNGGGVICDGVSPEISNNYFYNNRTLEPLPWNPEYIHEKAHDGGAIYGVNGASPVIRNNVFTGNETENGRGAAIALHGQCGGKIHHNLFLHNTAGLNDQHRSSDGGAVSVFDRCKVDVTHNLFMGNRALTKNDGGALFYALWSSGHIHGNYFFNNQSMDDAGALFVGGQEHRYDAPLDPLPPADQFFMTMDANVFMGNSNPSLNSGAFRITMESRGSFTNNLVAFNNGAFFQRSEVDIINNTIIDNLLIKETKEGLNPCRLVNTLVMGEISIRTETEITGCLLLEKENKEFTSLRFLEDGIVFQTMGAMTGNDRTETRIIVDEEFAENNLKNRVVRAGNRFTLVKENRGSEIIVYGDLSAHRDFILMPSYSPSVTSPAADAGIQVSLEHDLYGNRRPGEGVYDIGAVEIN